MEAEPQGHGQHERGAVPGAAAAAERHTASGPEGKHTNKKSNAQSLSQYEPSPKAHARGDTLKPSWINHTFYRHNSPHISIFVTRHSYVGKGRKEKKKTSKL